MKLKAMPYIIAEIGSNWHTLEDCMRSIEAAAHYGADAAKFQLYTCEDLYGEDYADWPGKKWELPKMWVPAIAGRCAQVGIDFMCTVFNPKDVEFIDDLVSVHKIASSDCNYEDLLRAVAKCDKPVMLSTGGHTIAQAKHAASFFKPEDLCVMYCVSAYPATNINLFKIDALRQALGSFTLNGVSDFIAMGFSDHTTDVYYYPRAAVVNHGAIVIEKHFTMELGPGCPDWEHSLKPFQIVNRQKCYSLADVIRASATDPCKENPEEPDNFTPTMHEFKEMVTYVRGGGYITPYEDCRADEADMREFHNRRQTEKGWYRVSVQDEV